MHIVVQKYGGTSLADSASREVLSKIVQRTISAGERPVLVVSAMGRRGDPYATDSLLDLLKEYEGGADGLSSDLMASCGEIISACLIATLLCSKGIPAVPLSAASAGISASGPFGDADPEPVDPSRLRSVLAAGKVPVVAGFQGIDGWGRVLTLGRGGSDTTAVALGAALGADFVDIYKDVPGVAKADPRLVPGAPFMPFLDYDSMFRLANHGARVLHDKSALLAKKEGVRMRVRSTFEEGTGTAIGPMEAGFRPPDFIGLSNSPGPEGSSKLTAVFALGKGRPFEEHVVAFAREAGMRRIESGDPDAFAFLCPAGRAKELAPALFGAIGG